MWLMISCQSWPPSSAPCRRLDSYCRHWDSCRSMRLRRHLQEFGQLAHCLLVSCHSSLIRRLHIRLRNSYPCALSSNPP